MGRHLIFVDCEARGASPIRGTMTEFGAVDYETRKTFHGKIYEGKPDPENPAVPLIGNKINDDKRVAHLFADWIKELVGNDRAIMVSDNIAYDWQWISAMFDNAGIENPFGHSGRRISDYYAGLTGKFSNTQAWKRLRKTVHDHNPVNDAMGNVEAFERLEKGER